MLLRDGIPVLFECFMNHRTVKIIVKVATIKSGQILSANND